MDPKGIRKAIEEFWFTRGNQKGKLADGGAAGGEARANGHMKTLENLVKQAFLDCGIPEHCIHTGRPYLPGYYRVRKQWDLVVIYKGALVAAFEFKSQVGSVGKNFGNRFEEALGSATDLDAAQKKNGSFGDVPPWLGYVFVLQETDETETEGRATSALFPTDSAFEGLSYNQRYQEMLRRFIGEGVYHGGWFVTTQRNDDGSVTYGEPLATATGRTLQVAIEGRVKLVKAMLGD
ncbi:PaeR7I family type II restriction endonuclease [Streptomyces cinnamoneus]|uniref:Type-2 restriction enzyme n=1 Tax=Streptomyces cinnamoneus TaxID=53446 RepID=A0A918WCG0_STRCJ|nr:PaeR7I family type II restriction endonuclease [Streptomyces cinnamoneus]GHC35698.1 type-2 restriction enzyme [Streptomyces cinnamoneus]